MPKQEDLFGLLAGSLLQIRRVDGWQSRIQAGEGMVDILLSNVKSKSKKEDKKIAREIENQVQKRNAELASTIEPLKRKFTSDSHVILAIPMSWMTGSHSGIGHVNFELNGQTIRVRRNMTARFDKPGTSLMIEVRDQDAGISFLEGKRPGEYAWIWVPKADLISDAGGTHSIHNGRIEASHFSVVSQKIEGFTTWLLIQ